MLMWFNYFELFLAIDCSLVIAFNVVVLFMKKVYKSWSTASILIAFSLLLLSRIGCLCFYALEKNDLPLLQWLLISSIVTDLPTFLCMNITLALIWQWWRISKLLTEPVEETAVIKSGKSTLRLIQV